MNWKRILTTFGVACLISVTLGGCGIKSVLHKDGNFGDGKERVMTFLHNDTSHQDVYEALAQSYMQEHTGLTIEVQGVPKEEYAETWFSLRDDDYLADIFAIPVDEFQVFAESGQLYKLNDIILPADYDCKMLQFGTYDKDALGIPVTGASPLIFYRADLYDEYGLVIPNTVSDFVINCQILKEYGYTPFALSLNKNGYWDVLDFAEGIIANGPRNSTLVYEGILTDGASELDGGFYDIWGAAFSLFLSELIPEKDSAPADHDSLLKKFADKEYAMVTGDSSDMIPLQQMVGDDSFSFFSMPGNDTVFGGVWKADLMLGVNKASKVKTDAENFIGYLLSAETQTILCDGNCSLPAIHRTVLKTEALNDIQKMLHAFDGCSLSVFQRISNDEKDICIRYLDSFFSLQYYNIDDGIAQFKNELQNLSE